MYSTCVEASATDDQTVLKLRVFWMENVSLFCHDVPVFCPTLIKAEEQE